MLETRNLTVLVLCCLMSLTVLAGCDSPALVPTSFARYGSSGEEFACEYPEGWQSKGGGKHGRLWAKFSSGSALIHVKSSTVGAIFSDHLKSRDSHGAGPQFEPIHLFHLAQLKKAKDEFDDYTEEPGSPMVLTCDLGPARVSEFTAKTTFGSKIHGYRATIAAHDLALIIYCTCPEKEWQALKPACDHLLGSFERG